jgi:hypothetical protein
MLFCLEILARNLYYFLGSLYYYGCLPNRLVEYFAKKIMSRGRRVILFPYFGPRGKLLAGFDRISLWRSGVTQSCGLIGSRSQALPTQIQGPCMREISENQDRRWPVRALFAREIVQRTQKITSIEIQIDHIAATTRVWCEPKASAILITGAKQSLSS